MSLETLPSTTTRHTGVFDDHGFERHGMALYGESIAKKYSLPTTREATLEEIEHSPRSFLQLLGRNGSESEQVASLSFGLAGGLSTIKAVIESVAQGQGVVRTYGEEEDQITVFIEEDIAPEEMLNRLILGPKHVYDQLPGLTAQSRLQDIRNTRLLNLPKGKGRFFEDIFYSRADGFVKALQLDGSSEFASGSLVRGNELWSKNIDDQPQSFTSLALDDRVDPAMRDNLLDTQQFLAETPKGRKRYVVKINADPTVFCCVNATNAQLGEKISPSINKTPQVDFLWTAAPFMFSFESEKYCQVCEKKNKECICSKD